MGPFLFLAYPIMAQSKETPPSNKYDFTDTIRQDNNDIQIKSIFNGRPVFSSSPTYRGAPILRTGATSYGNIDIGPGNCILYSTGSIACIGSIPGTDNTKVAKAGDTMTGALIGPAANFSALNSTGNITASTITANGSGGINISLSAASAVGPTLVLQNPASSGGEQGRIKFQSASSVDRSYINFKANPNGSGEIYFGVGNAPSDRMILGTTGYLGIGTLTPKTDLDLNGGLLVRSSATFTSTVTIQGTAFSVGASTFVVSGGSVVIGAASISTNTVVFDVEGAANSMTGIFNPSLSSGAIVSIQNKAFTNTQIGPCISTLTLNMPITSTVMVGANVTANVDALNGEITGAILMDGNFQNGAGGNATRGNVAAQNSLASEDLNLSFSMPIFSVAAGAHNFCISFSVSSGNGSTANGSQSGRFWVYRLP